MNRATSNAAVGELLINQRRRLGLSQTQLSQSLAGIDPRTACSKSRISEIENGRGLPSIGLARLCDQFFKTGNQFQQLLSATKSQPYLDKYASTESTGFAVRIELITTKPSEPDQTQPPTQQSNFHHFQPIHTHLDGDRSVHVFGFGATTTIESFEERFDTFQQFARWLEQHNHPDDRDRFSWPLFFCAYPTKTTWSQQRYERALQLLSAPSELRATEPTSNTIDLTRNGGTAETLFLDSDYQLIGSQNLSWPPTANCYATPEGIAYHPTRPASAPTTQTVTALTVQTQALLCAAHAINTGHRDNISHPDDEARQLQQLLLALTTPTPGGDRHYQHLVDGITTATRIDQITNAAITHLNNH